jgi:hypothetical protein
MGFLAVCLSLFEAQICQAQDFSKASLALNDSALFRSDPTLLNAAALSSPISFDWVMPEEALPSSSHLAASQSFSAPASSNKRLIDRLSDALPKFEYATGEIGFMYGRSTGKYGGSFKQGYITGEAGNDKTQVFVGASYEDSSFRFPRFGR